MIRPLAWLHPALVAMPASRRREALRQANREPFDALELVGMAAVLVAAGWIAIAEQRALALGIILVAAAIVFLRRYRRGLVRALRA